MQPPYNEETFSVSSCDDIKARCRLLVSLVSKSPHLSPLEKAHILTIIDLFLLTWDNLIMDMPDFTDELKMVSFRIGLLLKTEKLVNTADNILSLVQKLS